MVGGPADRELSQLDRPSPRIAGEPRIAGAVLCGGRSSRFGSDKALAPADGVAMGARVVAAMRESGIDPIVAVASDAAQGGRLSAHLAVPSIVDRWPGDGPLGGLVTTLLWFRTGQVLVLPCDLPRLTGPDLEPLLTAAAADATTPVVAQTDRGPNCSIGVWPAAMGPDLKDPFTRGARRLDTALSLGDWRAVRLAEEAVTDADTTAELDDLLRQGKPSGDSSD